MLYFLIELDEKRILEDDLIDLEAAYKCIHDIFEQRDVYMFQQEGAIRFYTRMMDANDFDYMWMVNSLFKLVPWFQYYVKKWEFHELDEITNEIVESEDLMEHWLQRPVCP